MSRESKSVSRVTAAALMAEMADACVKGTIWWSAEKSKLLRQMLCVTSKLKPVS